MNRGQLVIAAGAVVAIALIAVLGAALQLGYQPAPEPERVDPPAETRRVIETVLTQVEPAVREYEWGDHEAAVQEVRPALTDGLQDLQIDRAGIGRTVEPDTEAALERLGTLCPRTGNRSFGSCTAIDGIVLQERQEMTHLVAVVLEVTVRTDTGTTDLTVVVKPSLRAEER